MKTAIQLYDNLKQVVKFFYKQLKLDKFEKSKGRKLALSSIVETISPPRNQSLKSLSRNVLTKL